MHLYPIDGAVHRVGSHDTAFSYREAKWSAVFVGVDPDPDNNEHIIGWTKEYGTRCIRTRAAGRT